MRSKSTASFRFLRLSYGSGTMRVEPNVGAERVPAVRKGWSSSPTRSGSHPKDCAHAGRMSA